MNRPGEHAIVIGASMGGLVAAAALAPHFARVTIIERDRLPAEPAHRRGVPQSRHAHGLQPGGLLALENLLPGITDALAAGGAPIGDTSGASHWVVGGSVFARGDCGARAIGMTRPFLEHAVRSRVAALPGVTIRDGLQVDRPLAERVDDGPLRVVGVQVSPARGAGAGAEEIRAEEIRAELVVDASGRVSKLPDWLRDLGYPAPVEEQVHCKMAYLTRRWRLADDGAGHDILTVVTPATAPEFGVMIAQEDGSFIVTLGGLLDGAPARDDAAYRAFARRLPDPRIADALDRAEPVTEFQPSHFPYSRRRRYDRLSAFPPGLLAIGDSIASFNPMYGQGMTVAALEAVALRDGLARGPLDPRRFFRQAHRIEDVAWKISTGGDLRYAGVEGRRTPDMKIMNWYLDRLAIAAQVDPELAFQFLRVAGFMVRPETFFKPSVIRRVIVGGRLARRRAASVTEAPGVPAIGVR